MAQCMPTSGKADGESYSGLVAQQSVDVQFVGCPHKHLSASHRRHRKFQGLPAVSREPACVLSYNSLLTSVAS